ncbi:(2Fe-2S)-binding protein [Desulfosporosinus burensis]
MSSNKRVIVLNVNNQEYEVLVKPQQTLLEVLRETVGLTGTKSGCNEGSCGACTVLVDNKPTLACSTLAIAAEGKEIMTIEGLAGDDGKLHPVQQSFVENGAIQCGFCTPGMVLSAKSLLDRISKPNEEEIKEALGGNLCRCTGYTKIIKAVKLAAEMNQ